MAKEPVTAPATETKPEGPVVHAEGSVEIGTAPGEWNIAHEKKDGSTVVITVITN